MYEKGLDNCVCKVFLALWKMAMVGDVLNTDMKGGKILH